MRRAAPPEQRHRRDPVNVRPRRGRIATAGAAVLVTLVSVLGGLGMLPAGLASADAARSVKGAARAAPAHRPPADRPVSAGPPTRGLAAKPPSVRGTGRVEASAPPEDSGAGRRIVFDMAAQRVWLVGRRDGEDVVRRTYPVSGSLTNNLGAGTYSVYSKSARAVGIEDSGTMRYMVRFTRGDNAAIGFHDIPVSDGRLVQTYDDLGTPRSHGCIRQWRPDARALWRFAPVGTKVVVV